MTDLREKITHYVEKSHVYVMGIDVDLLELLRENRKTLYIDVENFL